MLRPIHRLPFFIKNIIRATPCPHWASWPILGIPTAILSITGLIWISIAITYLIPVASAEITKRKISIYITTLGCSIEDILMNYWNGKNFKELEQHFISLSGTIILHAQNHEAYSVLHLLIFPTKRSFHTQPNES